MQRPEDFESGFLQLCAMSYDQVNADTLSIGALPENPFYDSTVYENISIVAKKEVIEAMMAHGSQMEIQISYVGRVMQISSKALWKVGSTSFKIVTLPFSFFKK